MPARSGMRWLRRGSTGRRAQQGRGRGEQHEGVQRQVPGQPVQVPGARDLRDQDGGESPPVLPENHAVVEHARGSGSRPAAAAARRDVREDALDVLARETSPRHTSTLCPATLAARDGVARLQRGLASAHQGQVPDTPFHQPLRHRSPRPPRPPVTKWVAIRPGGHRLAGTTLTPSPGWTRRRPACRCASPGPCAETPGGLVAREDPVRQRPDLASRSRACTSDSADRISAGPV